MNEKKRRDHVKAEYVAMYDQERLKDAISFERARNPRSMFYQAIDPRRKQEYADGGMVRESNEMANLPSKAQHHEFPKEGYFSNPFVESEV